MFRWLLDATAAALVLSIVGLGVMALMRRPARRAWVAVGVLAGMLVVGALQAWPVTRVGLAVVDPGTPVMLPWLDGGVVAAAGPGSGGGGVTVPVVVAARRMAWHWREIVEWIYLAGLAAGLLRLGIGIVGLRRLGKRARAGRRLARVGGSGGRVWVGYSDQVSRPMTFGVLRPMILFPSGLRALDGRAFRSLVRHEAAHLRSGDALATLVAAMAGALFWWVPTVYLIRRRLRLDQEHLADHRAAPAAGGKIAYAEVLLALAKRGAGWQGADLALGAVRSRDEMMRRLAYLFATPGRMLAPCTRGYVGVVLAAAALVSAGAAAVTLAQRTEGTQVRDAEMRGAGYLLASQEADGSWLGEYGPAGTALVVRSLLQAGIPVDHPAILRARAYVEGTGQADGGYYGADEPAYNTAIALGMFAAFGDEAARARVAAGERFLQGLSAPPSRTTQGWYAGGPGANSGSPIRRGGLFADPAERSSEMLLATYGDVSYAHWKSLLYRGLHPGDAELQRSVRWLDGHWTVERHPGTGSQEGLFYYYVAAARTLRAAGIEQVHDERGNAHAWREDLAAKLLAMQGSDGSWVNQANGRWLENQPVLVTAYALLGLEEARAER